MPRKPQTPEQYGAVYKPKHREDLPKWEVKEEEPPTEEPQQEQEQDPEWVQGKGEPQQPVPRDDDGPYYIYVSDGGSKYEYFDKIFNTRTEALQFAQQNLKGKIKIMSQKQVETYLKEQSLRQQDIEKAKSYVTRKAKNLVAPNQSQQPSPAHNFLESAYGYADHYGMTSDRIQHQAEQLMPQRRQPRTSYEYEEREPEPQPGQQPRQQLLQQPRRQSVWSPEPLHYKSSGNIISHKPLRSPHVKYGHSQPKQQRRFTPKEPPRMKFNIPRGPYKPPIFGQRRPKPKKKRTKRKRKK